MTEFNKYQNEVKEKWGQTEVYKEHSEKTKTYSKEKWNNLASGMDQIMAMFSTCLKNGNEANSVEAQELVRKLQNHISENYYHCTSEILASLGGMYVADERFKNNIDKHAIGTAEYISKAINFYCKK